MIIDAISVKNLFSSDKFSLDNSVELTEIILKNSNITIERIVSNGQHSADGFWYDQMQDEWVMLLTGSAQLQFEGNKTINLKSGDYILIPAHCKHRVNSTSAEPKCFWLAIHGNLAK
ncbi:MAG: cupin domain-containing protein [Bacteroidota bacterium]